jgi:hypothetical protein
MIVVRNVFEAKYGKGDELVQFIKESDTIWPSERKFRIMTDLSGRFFTIVTETDYESFSAWEADSKKYFGDDRFVAWFERMVPLVESGSREFYTLVE